jgi:N-acetylglucosamine kinase-like BadF-type ATPase
VPEWFLGVDGGQSSTAALIADSSGQVYGVGHAGPCDHVATSESRARFHGAITEALQQALAAAALPESTVFAAACLGVSGGPADKEAIVREIVHAEKYSLTTDALIALTGALGGEPGVIAIAGTGSIAYGRNAVGKIARAGGWGYAFGDEGGAFDVTRQALRAALRNEEGWGPHTSLRQALHQATGVANMNDLLHRFYTPEFPRAKIASLAPLVDQAAHDGDAVAQDIMKGAAQSLAVFTAAVRRQLFHRGETARVSYIGGVFESDLVRERFRLLVELEGDAVVKPPAHGPAAGALMEALRMAQVPGPLRGAPAGV